MDLWLILGNVCVLISLAGVAWRTVRRARTAPRTTANLGGRWIARHLAPAVTANLAPELQKIAKELSPNSGTSMSDKVTRIDQWREDFTDQVTGDLASIQRHLRRQDSAMVRHLEAHAGQH